jgi:hypothetical protein
MKKRNADEYEEEEKPPPRKMIKTVRGQQRKYQFLKSVKSLDELDHIRFKVFSKINGSKLFFIGNGFFCQLYTLTWSLFVNSVKMSLDPTFISGD